MIDYAASLLAQTDELLRERNRMVVLHETVGRPQDLSLSQWFQIYSLAKGFHPDLIVELGRGYGNSTCVFGEVAANSEKGRVVSIGNDSTRSWETLTLPRLRGRVTPEWLRRITIVQDDIMNVDLVKLFENSERTLLFWDAHGSDLAYYILGKALPALRNKEHVVLVHDMTDSRYSHTPTAFSKEPPVRLWMGPINSNVEELIPLYDFLSRNGIDFASPGDSIRGYLEKAGSKSGEASAKLRRLWEDLVGGAANVYESHWLYFSLDGRSSSQPLVFPPSDMDLFTALWSGKESATKKETTVVRARRHPALLWFPGWKGVIQG